MTDTTPPVTALITRLITTEQVLLVVVAHLFASRVVGCAAGGDGRGLEGTGGSASRH
jgi:hypothetical protein